MKKKTIAGLIVIAAIIVVAMFTGCVEEVGPTPTPVPTSTPTSTPIIRPTATPTIKTDLGKTAIIGNVSFSVVDYEFEHTDVRHNWTEVQFFFSSQELEDKEFLWSYVKAKNVGKVSCTIPRYNERYFKCDIDFMYKNQTTECLYLSGDVGRNMYNPPKGRYFHPNPEDDFPKAEPNVTYEGWTLYTVPKDVDITQAKIQVYFPEAKQTATWNLY